MFAQTQINLQKQDQQLGYDILGRLFSAAENYYFKCIGVPYEQHGTNYSSYDIFHNANKKSKEAVRRELINQINIFQTSNQYFISKYNQGLQPPNLQLAIQDLNMWKKAMKSQKDIELYDAILKVVNNNQVNTDDFSEKYPNEESNKKGRQEFWANIGTYSSAATQQRINDINNNPNYQPTFNRGNYGSSYENSKPAEFEERFKLQEEANKVLDRLIPLISQYSKGEKALINEIKQSSNKLEKLVKKLDDKGAYLYPQSIIPKENFISELDKLIKKESRKENIKVFSNLREIFVESFV